MVAKGVIGLGYSKLLWKEHTVQVSFYCYFFKKLYISWIAHYFKSLLFFFCQTLNFQNHPI